MCRSYVDKARFVLRLLSLLCSSCCSMRSMDIRFVWYDKIPPNIERYVFSGENPFNPSPCRWCCEPQCPSTTLPTRWSCGRFERTCGDETMSLCRLEAKPEGMNRINPKTYCWWKKSGDHHLLSMKSHEKWDINGYYPYRISSINSMLCVTSLFAVY